MNKRRWRMNPEEETGNTLMAASTSRSFSSSMIKEKINAGNMAVTRQIIARMTILYEVSTGRTSNSGGRAKRRRMINITGTKNIKYRTGSLKISLRSFLVYVRMLFIQGLIWWYSCQMPWVQNNIPVPARLADISWQIWFVRQGLHEKKPRAGQERTGSVSDKGSSCW